MKLILLLALTSCAHQRYASKGAVLDLARTSYHKGCVDLNKKLKRKKSEYKRCREMSLEHQKEIKYIFDQ